MPLLYTPPLALSNVVPFTRPIPIPPSPIGLGIGAGLAIGVTVAAIAAGADLIQANQSLQKAEDNAARVSARPVNSGVKVTQGTPPYKGGQTQDIYYDVSFTRTRGDGLVTRFSRPLGNGSGNWVYGKIRGTRVDTPAPNSGQVMRLVVLDRDGEKSMIMASGNVAYDPANPASIYTFSDISFDLFTFPNQNDTGGDPPLAGGGDPLLDGYNGDRSRGRDKVPPPQIPSPKPVNTVNNVTNITNNVTNNTTINTGIERSSNTRVGLAPPPAAPTITPPPVRTTPPAPKEGDKKEEKKITPPFIAPKDGDDIRKDLLGIGAIVTLIAANTQPQNQRVNAKNGSCDALNSPECTNNLKNDIVNPLGLKIDRNAIAQDVALGTIAVEQQAQKGVLAAIAAKATDIFDLIGKLFNNSLVDKAMQYITMITVINNAAMLSRGIGDTLGSAIDNAMVALNFGFKDKDGNLVGVNQALGNTTRDLIKKAIGNDVYEGISNTFIQANRIYQSGINLLSSVQSIIDSTTAVAELTSNRVATLMNSLRNAGVVREDAYRSQTPNTTRFNAFMQKLENLEQGTSNVAAITGNIVSVQQSVNELKTNRTEFENAIKDKNTVVETEKTEKREESVFSIGDFSIVKPPEES